MCDREGRCRICDEDAVESLSAFLIANGYLGGGLLGIKRVSLGLMRRMTSFVLSQQGIARRIRLRKHGVPMHGVGEGSSP